MKKIGLLTLVIILLCGMSAFAETISIDTEIDISNGRITVLAESDDENDTVTIQIFNGGKTTADFAASVPQAALYAVYAGQGVTDENGDFAFEFKYSGASEILNAYIVYENGTAPKHFTIPFTGISEYATLIENLNGEKDFETFYGYCDANKVALCPNLSLVGSIDFRQASKYFYDEIQKSALTVGNSVENQKRFMSCIVAQALNEGKLISINAVADRLDLADALIEDIQRVAEDGNADSYFVKLMSNKGITTNNELEEVITENMILTAVRYPDGFANLEILCEKYVSFGKNYPGSAYKAVAGTAVNSLRELESKLAAASGNSNGTTGGTAGGFSGGGGGGGGRGSFAVVGDELKETARPTEVHMPFDDLSSANWAYKAVSVLADRGIVNGKTETEFYPNDYVTREEFLKMIVGSLNLKATGESKGRFTDVDDGMWYAPYVYAGYDNGVCRGVTENSFGIGQNIIRQDAAVMIYNVLSEKASGTGIAFADADSISDYAVSAVDTLSAMQIINGKGNNQFEPLSPLTRAEAAQIIYKSFFSI